MSPRATWLTRWWMSNRTWTTTWLQKLKQLKAYWRCALFEHMGTLEKIRAQIDELDQQIQKLINERARCAQQIAGIKQAGGEQTPFYRPEREAQILRAIQERNTGPL